MKILLIDDEDDMGAIAGMSLSAIGGMTVADAASGREGIRLAAADRPDLILLDVVMPDMDGETTFRILRETPATCDIPVVFLTGSRPDEVAHLRSLGARGILFKPIDALRLPEDVLAAMEGRDGDGGWEDR